VTLPLRLAGECLRQDRQRPCAGAELCRWVRARSVSRGGGRPPPSTRGSHFHPAWPGHFLDRL